MLLTTTAKVNAVKKLFRAKQYDEALEIAEKINPEKVSSVYDLSTIAEVYMKKERYQDAKDLYLEMYGRNKTHKVMTGLIEICLKLKEPKEAEQYLREFRRMEPDNPERLVYRYRVDCMLGKDPEFLIKSLSKLKNEEYTDVWALELAKAYYKNNDREACAKECRQILQYFPDSEFASKARVLFDACVTEEEPVAVAETPAESVDTTAMAESLMEDVSALLEENARAEAVANESLDEKSIAQATPAHSEPYLRTPEFLSLHQPAGEDRSLFGEPDLGEKAQENDAAAVKEEIAAEAVAAEEPVKAEEEAQELSEAVEETAQTEAAEATEFAEEVTEKVAAGVAGAADSLEALRETYVLPEELEGKIDHVFFDDDDDDDFDDEFEDELDDDDNADEAGDDAEEADADGDDEGEEAGADESEEAGGAEEADADGIDDDEADDEEDDDDDDDELVVVGAYGDEEQGSEDVEDTAEAADDEADEESDDSAADADDSPADETGNDDETAAEDEDDNDADSADDEFDDDELTEEDLDEFDDDVDDLETLDGVDDDDFDDEFDDEDYDDLDEYDDDELDEEDSDDEDLDEDDDSCDEENFPEDESEELRAEDVVFAPSDKADEELEAVAERLGNEVCSATAEANGSEADDESDEKKMADTQVVPCVKEKKEIPDEDMEKMLFNLLKDIGGKESK